jgi:hypothetical protein
MGSGIFQHRRRLFVLLSECVAFIKDGAANQSYTGSHQVPKAGRLKITIALFDTCLITSSTDMKKTEGEKQK